MASTSNPKREKNVPHRFVLGAEPRLVAPQHYIGGFAVKSPPETPLLAARTWTTPSVDHFKKEFPQKDKVGYLYDARALKAAEEARASWRRGACPVLRRPPLEVDSCTRCAFLPCPGPNSQLAHRLSQGRTSQPTSRVPFRESTPPPLSPPSSR